MYNFENSPHPLTPSSKRGEGEPNPPLAPLPPWERGWGEGGSGKLYIALPLSILLPNCQLPLEDVLKVISCDFRH